MGMNIMRMKGRAKMMRTIKVTGKGKIAVKPDKSGYMSTRKNFAKNMKILSEGQQKIQSFSRICLRNLVFREKTLKQYILMSIQNMKAIRTEIRAGSEDLKVISIITI